MIAYLCCGCLAPFSCLGGNVEIIHQNKGKCSSSMNQHHYQDKRGMIESTLGSRALSNPVFLEKN